MPTNLLHHGPPKQGRKKWSKHGCDKGTLTVVTSKQTTTKPCRNESGEKKGETDGETRAKVRNDEGAITALRVRSESAQ